MTRHLNISFKTGLRQKYLAKGRR